MENQTNTALIETTNIKDMIYIIRGQQVMLDLDLAKLYGYEVKHFNQQVKRNIERFPEDFMFELTKDEMLNLSKSQIVTSIQTKGVRGGRTSSIKVFTEQGIYMLATVLKGEIAVNQSIMIMRSFRKMRHYINENQQLLNNADTLLSINYRLTIHEEKLKKIDKIEKDIYHINQRLDNIANNFIEDDKIKQFIIMNGQKFEANEAYVSIYKQAKHSIYIIDDYINIDTLSLLKHKNNNINVIIFSDNKGRNHGKLQKNEYDNFNKEYPSLTIKKNNGKSHDRYIILDYNTDNEKIYHCGASSKDAGNKLCGINQIIDITPFHFVIDDLLLNDEYVF